MKNGRGHLILGDPGAASREDRMFLVKVYYKIEKLFFWPIEAGNSNASGTGSVRVSPQGFLLDLTVKFHQEHSLHL